MTTLTIPWTALASDNRRHVRAAGKVHGRDYKAAREAIHLAALNAVRGERPRYAEPVEVTMDFYPPDFRRRDASNLLKCLLDGMTGVVYADDSLVKSLSYLVHSPDGSDPRVEVSVQLRRAA